MYEGSTCKEGGGKCHACCEAISRHSLTVLNTKAVFWTVGFVTKAVAGTYRLEEIDAS